jgi:hypothetical protein
MVECRVSWPTPAATAIMETVTAWRLLSRWRGRMGCCRLTTKPWLATRASAFATT